MVKALIKALSEMQEDEAIELVKKSINNGADPAEILADCQEAMKIVGDRYEKKDYFLPELIMSGMILKKISDIVKPKLKGKAAKTAGAKGKIVLGTVRGDIHDIGKDIVGFMLDVSGFEVTDLGVDVPEEKFVEAVNKVKPQVVALSGFLTLAYDSMKTTIEALKKAGLRTKVKVMIGGGMVDEKVKEYVGADGYGLDAATAIRLAREWIPTGK